MLSLGKGAWSTLRGHVRRWEAFEKWAQPVCVYPPTVETILRYYGHKDANSCGPCVLPAFRGTLLWMCRRLCMTPPALESPVFGAVEARVIERRGREVAEAVPIPIWPCDPWRDRWSNGAPLATPSHALLRGRRHWRFGRHSGLTTAFTSTRPLCDSPTLHCTSQRRGTKADVVQSTWSATRR